MRQPALRRPRPRGHPDARNDEPAARRPGPGPTACRLSPRSAPSTSRPRSPRRCAAHLAEIDAIAARARSADLRQYVAAFDRCRASARARRARCSTTSRRARLRRRCRPSSARWRRCSLRTTAASTPTRSCLRASMSCTRGAMSIALSTASSGACSSASTWTSFAPAPSSRRAEQKRYAAVMQRLAELTTRFGQNVLADESGFRLVLKDESRSRRPADVRARRGAPGGARARASTRAWVVTLSRSHIVPFLTFSRTARPARAGAGARGRRAASTTARATTAPVARRDPAAAPRAGAPARLLELSPTSRSPTRWRARRPAVTALLEQVWRPARARAEDERAALAALRALARRERARSSPGTGASTPRKCARCASISTKRQIKPYFPLDAMVAAAFDCADAPVRRLASSPRPTSPSTTRTSSVYEVHGADGRRSASSCTTTSRAPSKRSGAWMSSYREQSQERRCRRRSGAADRRQQQQLRQGRAGRADAAQLRRRAHALPRVRPRPARAALERHATSGCRAPTCCAISSSCRRSCSSTGSRSPRCSSATRATTGPARRSPMR